MSLDDSSELTRKSTRGIFILHLTGLPGLEDERISWCVSGLLLRLGDFREAGQPKREQGAACGALGVGLGDGTRGGVPKDGYEVRFLSESVSELDHKIVIEL